MTNKLATQESGQALVELSLAFVILAVFAFGVVDFGRAIYDVECMRSLGGESSRLASYGAKTSTTASSVVNRAGSWVNLASQGCVIITAVTNNGGTLQVTDQAAQCAVQVSSKIGCLQGQAGCNSSTPVLPAAATNVLQGEVSGSSLYITEIFYNFSTTSPITSLLQNGALPSQLYTASYY